MTTFISYSRNNSDFALRLARDLRGAGFDIWLDQLDIRTGARWDDEVEKALEKSTTFLIVLTPESIQSQNVKDEIGYAINAGKNILPIILKPCNVPFRLRRFQYVDFSNIPYDESFIEIKHLLTNTNELASEKGNKEASVQIDKSVAKSEPEKAMPPRKWNTLIAIGVIGVTVIALTIILTPIFNKQFESQTPTQISVSSSKTFIPLSLTETLDPSLTSTETLASTPTPLPAEIIDKGVPMVLVAAGEFTMGSESGDEDEKPVHIVYLDDFYMDKFEVTNALYKACVAGGVCEKPRDTRKYDNPQYTAHPVVDVNWSMAKAYCEWRGAKLPTESEWEKAARGDDESIYPWGASIDTTLANYFDIIKDTREVGFYEDGQSVYGVFDLAGNVWEWVADLYDPNYYRTLPSTSNNPVGPTSGKKGVIRGGSWNDDGNTLRSSNRAGLDLTAVGHDLGFRCARDANP